MAAEALNCPMCGASAKSEATRCEHCGTRLATIGCPSCFGLMFIGAKFCSHCGARAYRAEIGSTKHPCPRCKRLMGAVSVGESELLECGRCHGIWADAASLDQICADREKQAAVLGAATPLAEPANGKIEANIRYLPCPVCRKLMHRVNFARCSQVIVDVCKGHGTWFDQDELRRIVEFIKSGGMETARAREITELEERRRRAETATVANAWADRQASDVRLGVSSAGSLLRALFG
ncbi:MAG TPA: zf-TFIIB domain-containing protein [Clostridia bacterium]|nr:zf-TFIIB domain-containing protein [Clostridia bacterium]